MKKAFIVLTHREQMENGQKRVVEECEFVDKLKNRHYSNASVIIDCMDEKVVKTRNPEATYGAITNHVKQNYKQKYNQFLKVTGLEEREKQKEDTEEKTEDETTEEKVQTEE